MGSIRRDQRFENKIYILKILKSFIYKINIMEEEDDIIMYISNSEKESSSSDNDIEDNYINRKID